MKAVFIVYFIYFIIINPIQVLNALKITTDEIKGIRAHADILLNKGQIQDLLEFLNNIEEKYGGLDIDFELPSLHNYRGVAYHNAQMLVEAENSFLSAVTQNPKDTRSWINLGETRGVLFKLDAAIEAYNVAVSLGEMTALSRLLRVKGWTNSWHQFEGIVSEVSKRAIQCVEEPNACVMDSPGGLEYTDLPGYIQLKLNLNGPMTTESPNKIPVDQMASLWHGSRNRSDMRIKVGLVSSDFGVHPVATLVRGMVQYIDRTKIELFCFCLVPSVSWWGGNISETAEHFVVLQNKNRQEAAAEIASYGIHILIDLNGHTLHSGLPIMSHRPAPVQMSFLGFPESTGAPFVDYYISDAVATPPEHRDHFIEHLALLPKPFCYIANDYAQMVGDVLSSTGVYRAPRSRLLADVNLDRVPSGLMFATMSNFQKFDPVVVGLWLNIMRRFPASKLLMLKYIGHQYAIKNVRNFASAAGVRSSRLALCNQVQWIDHVYSKTALDLVLDTMVKNGHTTGIDPLWAGVPVISMGGGSNMPRRAAESIAGAMGSDGEVGISYSLKEYEDLAYSVAGDRRRLAAWRAHLERQRKTASLFDTKTWSKHFTRLMQATWDLTHVAGGRKFHLFGSSMQDKPNKIQTDHTMESRHESFLVIDRAAAQSKQLEGAAAGSGAVEAGERAPINPYPSSTVTELQPLPKDLFDQVVMLNIGGTEKQEGWWNLNSQSSSKAIPVFAQIIRDMHNLQGFPNASVGVIYSSHTLEHNGIRIGDATVQKTLAEWSRVLRPGGLLLLSVPDFSVLARMFLDDSLTVADRYFVLKMVYGAQGDLFDFHYTGFDEELLRIYLTEAGFCELERVGNFNIFSDTSAAVHFGYHISLNFAARPCAPPTDSFWVKHEASPYTSPSHTSSREGSRR